PGTFALTVEHPGTEALTVQAVDNVFNDFDHALSLTGADSADQELAVLVNRNEFNFDIDNLSDAAVVADMASPDITLDARHNKWGNNIDAGDVESYVQYNNSLPEVRLLVDPVIQP